MASPDPGPRRRADEPEVHRITDADVPLSEDQAGRQRSYLISMGLRTVCFLAAVFTPSPWRWFLVVGAVVLPYFAVVVANGGRERSDREGFTILTARPQRRALGRGK